MELSGVLIVAAVCAGVLIWRLSTQRPDIAPQPQAVPPETIFAQPAREGPSLTAKIGYNRKLGLLRVENDDGFAWSNCQLSLNAQGVSAGYTRALETISPGITDAALLETADFADGDGHKFDPARQEVATLDLACDTPRGQHSYSGRF